MIRIFSIIFGAGCVGGFVWLASGIEDATVKGFWVKALVILLAGIALVLIQSFSGARTSPSTWTFAALSPIAFVLGWLLIFSQPIGGWQHSQIVNWTNNLGLSHPAHIFTGYIDLLAFAFGVLLGFLLLPPSSSYKFDFKEKTTKVKEEERVPIGENAEEVKIKEAIPSQPRPPKEKKTKDTSITNQLGPWLKDSVPSSPKEISPLLETRDINKEEISSDGDVEQSEALEGLQPEFNSLLAPELDPDPTPPLFVAEAPVENIGSPIEIDLNQYEEPPCDTYKEYPLIPVPSAEWIEDLDEYKEEEDERKEPPRGTFNPEMDFPVLAGPAPVAPALPPDFPYPKLHLPLAPPPKSEQDIIISPVLKTEPERKFVWHKKATLSTDSSPSTVDSDASQARRQPTLPPVRESARGHLVQETVFIDLNSKTSKQDLIEEEALEEEKTLAQVASSVPPAITLATKNKVSSWRP